MNTSSIELRPRRLGELLDVAVRLVRIVFTRVALWVFLVELPFAVIGVLWTASLGNRGQGSAVAGAIGIMSALFMPAAVLVAAVAVAATHEAHLGRQMSGSRSTWMAVKRVPALIAYSVVAMFIYSIISFGIVIAIALPLGLISKFFGQLGPRVVRVVVVGILSVGAGILWFAGVLGLFSRFLVGMVSVIVERRGPFQAFSRGWDLTRKLWLRNGLLLAAATLASYIVLLVVVLAATALGGSNRGDLVLAMSAGLAFVVLGLLYLPFGAALAVAMFVDGRVRREALDLELLLGTLAPVPQ